MRRALVVLLWVVVVGCGGLNGSPRDGERDAGVEGTDGGASDAGFALDDAGFDAGPSCSETALDACEYASRALAFTVVRNLTVREPLTQRELPILVRIPDLPGPLPVVIFSHGGSLAVGNEEQSVAWGETFAQHGYLDLHVGHVPLGAEGTRALCAQVGLPVTECRQNGDEDSNGLLAIIRADDLSAVLDALPRLSALAVAQGRPAFDLDRVVLAGWSGGSRGPTLNLGATVTPITGAAPFSVSHPKPIAMLVASPTGPGFGGFYETPSGHSWTGLRGPTLQLTGTNDVKPASPTLDGPVRRRPFDLQHADGHRWLLYSQLPVGIGGHDTFNLGDRSSNDVRLSRLSRALQSAARAFLDAEVKQEPAARAWLESNQAATLAGTASWEHR